ncbi:hypothetical protein RhiJN_27623 [Ceratobasidium sp. AG-Ba]|nr:hypothetical protein RhiJN_13573 [Ceratobasidium sp. AG-Ba]QRV99604.1 hypothetical protein RhiJN_27623 [Ceratobasidium sp. AG-Ba]QRW14135.1 hypothetical protein RhiLY_13134 [Ceratobasidium sp. AG-Ba]
METFKLVYKYIDTEVADYQVEPRSVPWLYDYWKTPLPQPISFSSLIAPLYALDTGARTVNSPYETLSLDGFVATRSSSAVSPVHAPNGGSSAGVSSMVPAPLPTLFRSRSPLVVDDVEPVENVARAPSESAASTPPSPDAWAFNGPSPTPSPGVPPAHDIIVSMSVSGVAPPLLLSSAGSESTVATPVPTIVAVSPSLGDSAKYREPTNLADPKSPCWSSVDVSRSSRQSWFLNLVVLITVQVVVTVYLSRYYALCSQQGPESPINPELAEIRDLMLQLEDISHILGDFGLSPRQLRDYIERAVAARDAPVQRTREQALEGRTELEASRAREPRSLDEAEPVVKVYRSTGTSPMVPSPAPSRTRSSWYSEASTSTRSDEPSGSSMSSDLPAGYVSRGPEDVFQGEGRMGSASDDSMDAACQYPRQWSPAQSSRTESAPSDERWGNTKRIEVNTSPLAHKSRVAGLMLDIPRRPSRIKLRSPGSSTQPSASGEESGSLEFEPDTTSSLAPAGRGPLSGVRYSPVLARPSAPEPDATIEVESSVTRRKREWLEKWAQR